MTKKSDTDLNGLLKDLKVEGGDVYVGARTVARTLLTDDLAAKFCEAIGAEPGDVVQIVTPQFQRSENEPPPASVPSDWNALRSMSFQALREIGLRPWNSENGRSLMLLPGEWYEYIPEGFDLVCISGSVAPFKRGVTDNDIRSGCLAYGIFCDSDSGDL